MVSQLKVNASAAVPGALSALRLISFGASKRLSGVGGLRFRQDIGPALGFHHLPGAHRRQSSQITRAQFGHWYTRTLRLSRGSVTDVLNVAISPQSEHRGSSVMCSSSDFLTEGIGAL